MATVLADKTDCPEPDISQNRRAKILGFFASLLVVDCYLYFRNLGHFFQADTVYLLGHRVGSIAEFLREFTKLHESGWYRPLANETIESILYPIFGLNPAAYRIPVYALFIADTIAVYALSLAITRRLVAAVIATFFFNVHIVNAATTYDVAFTPELLYTLFYLGSVLAYLRYLDSGAKSARLLSWACFVGSLLSKEAAITLPLTLLAVYFFSRGEPGTGEHVSFWRRSAAAIRSISMHVVILLIYGAFVIGYLHVGGVTLTRLLEPQEVEGANYEIFLDHSMLKNADIALTWAFNIPRAWWSEFQHATPAKVAFLKIFRGMSVILAALVLLNGDRRVLLLGLTWFFLTLLPVLPLRDHFFMYYLFLPIVGFAMTIGTAFAWLSENLRRFHRFLPAAVLLPIFGGLLYVCSAGIRNETEEHPLLGGSARVALSSINDLKRLYPALRPGMTLYFEDRQEPLSQPHSLGALVKMTYNLADLSLLYASAGDPVPSEIGTSDRLIVLKMDRGRLVDGTAAFRADPGLFTEYRDSGVYELTARPNEVVAGRDSYTVRITGAPKGTLVRILYQLNDGPLEAFSARLDSNGESRLEVSPSTRTGLYRFIAFNLKGQPAWIRSQATVTVR